MKFGSTRLRELGIVRHFCVLLLKKIVNYPCSIGEPSVQMLLRKYELSYQPTPRTPVWAVWTQTRLYAPGRVWVASGGSNTLNHSQLAFTQVQPHENKSDVHMIYSSVSGCMDACVSSHEFARMATRAYSGLSSREWSHVHTALHATAAQASFFSLYSVKLLQVRYARLLRSSSYSPSGSLLACPSARSLLLVHQPASL